MSDLFDDFMRELQRRRNDAEGRVPRRDRPDDPGADDDEGAESSPDEREAGGGEDEEGREPLAEDAEAEPELGQPITIGTRGGRQRGAGGPPRRGRSGMGGPNDGARPPSIGSILRRVGLAAAIIGVLALVFLLGAGLNLWTDVIWYSSVGFDAVFWTRLGAEVGLFVGGLAFALVVLLANLWLAGRLAPPPSPGKPGTLQRWIERLNEAARQAEGRRAGAPPGSPFGTFGTPGGSRGGGTITIEPEELPDLVPLSRWVIGGFAFLAALGFAGAASGAWETILLWANAVPYSATASVTDPVFGRDISFFLFDLPFLRAVQALVSSLVVAALLVAGARYLASASRGGEVFVTPVRVHLAVLGGLYLFAVAAGYQLDKYELSYSEAGVATGVAYADANARFLAYDVLTFLSGLAGALLIGGAFTRWIWPLGVIIVVWFAVSILLGRLYPEAIQRFVVDPNQFTQEQPYIENNVRMTRLAFGLDDWESRPYEGEAGLASDAVDTEAATFANARLWDYRPLHTTLDQLQVVRQYYDFVDVDTDRYIVDGELRQVMLSARELARERNPAATGWVNERIIYTHGIGLAMVPVNEVTPEGQPRLWIRDLPPISIGGAPTISEPRIYFGERDNQYVVVNAAQAEFDYPRVTGAGAVEVETRWTGDTGIRLDSTLMRLLYALRFRDLDLLISDQVTSSSQLLFHRTLQDRLSLIAPFLRYDKDPYLVVADERLTWVQDAYTISDRFPHATWFDPNELGQLTGLAGGPLNYIRNSVKVTMDAYDGTMRFYVSDPDDPLIRAWGGIFPSLLTPFDQLPASLEAHLRVPEERFNVQTRVFGRYHVTNPLTFFQNADLWTVPLAQTSEQSLPPEAYYVVMRMPGEPEAEFLLLQPMIASNRPNMIAWVAARNDAPNYGSIRTYQFPSDTTIFGPAQIEARIDQDPIISAQITLWNQAGSRVIRGNLIVVPVGEALIYLQPVYLQSTSSAFPEFQKIVVASPTAVVWGDTLGDALEALIEAQGGGPTPTPTPTPGPTATPGPTFSPGPTGTPRPTLPPDGELPDDIPGLIEYANTHFELAQQALRDGDFARYGEEMDKVEAALRRLAEVGGMPTVTPAP